MADRLAQARLPVFVDAAGFAERLFLVRAGYSTAFSSKTAMKPNQTFILRDWMNASRDNIFISLN
jgi:hypothetical protein